MPGHIDIISNLILRSALPLRLDSHRPGQVTCMITCAFPWSPMRGALAYEFRALVMMGSPAINFTPLSDLLVA